MIPVEGAGRKLRETLKGLPEAAAMTRSERYEGTEGRSGYRGGSYDRKLRTASGESVGKR